jgi:hypothetical protein
MNANPSPTGSNLNQKLDRHFLACSALIGAAGLAGTQEANATIQYSGVLNLNVPNTNGQGGIYIDMETFSFYNAITNGSQPGGGPGPLLTTWDFNFYQSRATRGSAFSFYYNGNSQSTNPVLRYSEGVLDANGRNAVITPGTFLDNSLLWGQSGSLTNFYNSTGIIGVRFMNNANTQTNYGWIRVTSGSANGMPASIVDWAFEDSGGGILAGAVPEPSSIALGCLAAGALGVSMWRKRKRA